MLSFVTAVPQPGRTAALTTDRRTIARAYLRGWFLVDVGSTIPWDVIADSTGGGRTQLQLLGFLKTPRLLRLSKLVRYLNKTRAKNWNYFRIARLSFLLVMIAHWVACAYVLVATLESSRPSWLDHALVAEDVSRVENTQLSIYRRAASLRRL